MLKILVMVAMVVLGIIGAASSASTRTYPGDNIDLLALIFVVSLILVIAGGVGIGFAIASY